jgi:hypothetical protein
MSKHSLFKKEAFENQKYRNWGSIFIWRVAPTQVLKLEPYFLPFATEAKIRNFMKHLWIEDILPKVRVLDMFVHFMLSQEIDFQWRQNASSIKLNDYDCEVSRLVEIQMSQHVYLNQIKKQEVTV